MGSPSLVMTDRLATPATDVEIDVRALLRSLLRALPYLIVLLLVVAVGTYYGLSQIAPVYKSEATVLIETGESDLTRPANAPADSNGTLDEQAIASQVQLIRSRDVARNVVDQAQPRVPPGVRPGCPRRTRSSATSWPRSGSASPSATPAPRSGCSPNTSGTSRSTRSTIRG